MPLEERVVEVDAAVRARQRMLFSELVEDNPSTQNKVVSILALLELGKRDIVGLEQEEIFGDITITSHNKALDSFSVVELSASGEE